MPEIRSLSIRGRKLRLLHYGEVASTQAIARDLVARGAAPGTIIIADSQTGGRGRYGRTWVSPPGGLYTSIVLDPDSLLSLRAGVAVVETLIGYGLKARLKWPNDVTMDEKKIAGILIEEVSGMMILGIGVNLRETPYPGSTCVRSEIGRAPGPEEFLSAIVENLGSAWTAAALRADYRRLCATIGKEVSISSGSVRIVSRAVEIDRSGRLVLDTINGRKVISSGECTHLRPR